ncbi:hypothetical protein BDN72DRAFT_866337, partial [Pluteus cervinus]
MACLRSPLHCCLAISPLCLLMTFDLSKRNASRQDLLNAWIGLTATRPQRLREVEDVFWSALFDIATLNADVETRLREALGLIDVDALQKEWSRFWFQPSIGPDSVDEAGRKLITPTPSMIDCPPPYSLQVPVPNLNSDSTKQAQEPQPDQDDSDDEHVADAEMQDLSVQEKNLSHLPAQGTKRRREEGEQEEQEEEEEEQEQEEQEEEEQEQEQEIEQDQEQHESTGETEVDPDDNETQNPKSKDKKPPLKRKRYVKTQRPKHRKQKHVQDDDDIVEIGADQWFGYVGARRLRPLKFPVAQKKYPGKLLTVVDLDKKQYEYVPHGH